MKGKNKMTRLAIREWKLQSYERAIELVEAINSIGETPTKKSQLDDLVIEVLCVELKEILENLKIKI
tara:strand:+ start:2207 stop:2407 length:201 start_codon:yes stop_codon:yes gene_type:complete